ncbi:hypothetical protein PRIC1_005332 [Phytophthora ramorum]
MLRELSRLVLKTPKKVIHLSYWVFAVWWVVILSVHVITCVFNALYAYSYWKLKGSYLNLCLAFYQIGLPEKDHGVIIIVHAIVSTIHGICILLMLGGSLRQNSLAFTPWSSSTAGSANRRRSSALLQSFIRLYSKVMYPFSLCGVNGKYFHFALNCRELVETTLQTVQAYRMSTLLPRTLLNRFYVVLLVANCWSSHIADSVFFGRDEARRRFACIVMDCILDLMACTGVVVLVLLDYVGDYDPTILSFNEVVWYDDEWVARALNELRMVVIVSWSDLMSRTMFSLGLVITTTSMKRLLWQLPRNGNRVSSSTTSIVIAVGVTRKFLKYDKVKRAGPTYDEKLTQRRQTRVATLAAPLKSWYTHRDRIMLRAVHFLFGVWGIVVLGLHIHASVQPTLAQCLMQVRPWASSRPSCYLLALDCHSLELVGARKEVHEKWSEFNPSTVIQLLIRHCPMLEVPDIFTQFRELRGIKVYNTSIVDWGESAAITATNHPWMTTLFLVRVNMVDGLLPPGFQSDEFPQTLYDIEISSTNLRELPDDLDSKWPLGSIIYVEYSQLTAVPSVLLRLVPSYLSLTGNLITELPPEIFETEGLLFLAVSEMDISELPRNVTLLASSLSRIYISKTNISFFWSWIDDFVKNTKTETAPLRAAGSTYCNDLERLQDGAVTTFPVPVSPEYSTALMDPADKNVQVILKTVTCSSSYKGSLYPLAFDDSINAISAPLVLKKQC